MAALKEVKGRIVSVTSIQKITSAMRMIASAKLHRAQLAIGGTLPYEHKLHGMLQTLLASDDATPSPFMRTGEVRRVAIVAFSSNSSLAGAFNANIIRKFQSLISERYGNLPKENIRIYPVGRKIHDAVSKMGYTPEGDYRELADKPDYAGARMLAEQLIELFRKGEVDRVELVYNHFRNMASQVPTGETYLPIVQEAEAASGVGAGFGSEKIAAEKYRVTPDLILEPSRRELLNELLPKVLEFKIYTVLLDSAAAEHAARTVAMQVATDNADDLLQELTLQYNKSRQQTITSELLDIIGAAAAK